MERGKNEAEQESEDEIDMSKVGYRQADGEEKQINTYAEMLAEIDREVALKPYKAEKKDKEKEKKNAKPAKPVAPLVEAINHAK